MKIDKRHLLNYSILVPYLILSIIGLIMVYSTTSALQIQKGFDAFSLVKNQSYFWGISLVAIWVIYRMKLSFLRKKGVIAFVLFLEVLMLIASRFVDTVNGAHGWIRLGPVGLQPAEYLKLLMVWYLANHFASIQKEIRTYDYQALTKGRWVPDRLTDWRLISLIFLALVATLPDLGNATIIALIIVVMVTVSGISYRWFSTALLAKLLSQDRCWYLALFGYWEWHLSQKFQSLAILLAVLQPILIPLQMLRSRVCSWPIPTMP